MATTTEKSSPSTGSDSPELSENQKANQKAAESVDLENDPRFDIPTLRIVTAEDAEQAFLRGEIKEDELRAVYARYGKTSWELPKGLLERPDDAFQNRIPDSLLDDSGVLKGRDLKERLEMVNAKADEREEASKAASEEDQS